MKNRMWVWSVLALVVSLFCIGRANDLLVGDWRRAGWVVQNAITGQFRPVRAITDTGVIVHIRADTCYGRIGDDPALVPTAVGYAAYLKRGALSCPSYKSRKSLRNYPGDTCWILSRFIGGMLEQTPSDPTYGGSYKLKDWKLEVGHVGPCDAWLTTSDDDKVPSTMTAPYTRLLIRYGDSDDRHSDVEDWYKINK